ncbi:MAG: AraC family transcriptional regulator [Mycobacteriaceae bacterium]|nr:AraC family transcriptional regulator [Mycobacteriaceae bacterium]
MRTIDLLESAEPAPEAIRPWITALGRIPTVTDLAGTFTHVPEVVLRTEASGRRSALVLGAQTRASYNVADRPAGCVRLRLAPGAAPALLGVSAADLADRVVPLADLPGPVARLADELAELEPSEVSAYLESVLPQRITEDAGDAEHRRLLGAAVAALASGRSASVPAVAGELAVSERHLRALFGAGVGVSPKHYARIGRVRAVLTQAGNTPWTQLATATGYYDQSHLTADFRALMRVTPTKYLRGDVPTTACRAPSARG